MEAKALYDYEGQAYDELSFKKGTILKILNQDNKDWFRAEQNGQEGLVPSNYVQLKPNPWYHGKITRSKAEETLMRSNNEGEFLVRDSESTPGDFSLSVRCVDGVQHFKVLRDSSGKYFLWVVKFNSLNELVEYHKTSSVSRRQTIYLKCCPRERVKALFDFFPIEDNELGFKRGDLIEIVEKIDHNWWRGQLNNKIGVFPSNYVENVPKD